MAKVTIHGKGDLEKALRSFKRRCQREGIFQQCKERRHYTKPSVKRRQSAMRKKRGFKKFK
jgi:small subunit ribosomal protein S21